MWFRARRGGEAAAGENEERQREEEKEPERGEERAVVEDEYGVWHVLYSMHSSHPELTAFLHALQVPFPVLFYPLLQRALPYPGCLASSVLA
eukprot:1623737-Rhodomonas_salina.1